MNEFSIKIANVIFNIKSVYPYPKYLCEKYIVEEKGTVDIFVSKNELLIEKKRYEEQQKKDNPDYKVQELPPGYYEATAIYRKIAIFFIKRDLLVVHGALISYMDEGYLFIAKSGVGKTTHIENWKKLYDDVKVINGDKPILEFSENKVIAYGTPWCGKEGYNLNENVILKAIILLDRSNENAIKAIDKNEMLTYFISYVFKPMSDTVKDVNKIIVENVIKILSQVETYHLYCNMDIESAKVAYEGMKK